MPSILELFKAGGLTNGVKFEIPIHKREYFLPYELSGWDGQTLKTREPNELKKCVCVSTGEIINNQQLLCIGETLPIEITLSGFTGTINGSIAVDSACAALLSLRDQMISARNVTRTQYANYGKIAPVGEFDDLDHWISDYGSSCTKPDVTIGAGMYYVLRQFGEKNVVNASMCEILGEGGRTRFAEPYRMAVRPVYYLQVWNYALELERRDNVWVVLDK